MTLQQQLESGMSHHQAGRWAEAEAIYRQILSQNPNHPEALNLLGTLAAQMGRLDAAVELMRQAIGFKPDYADAHYNLAIVLQNKGQLDEAIVSYRQAIRLKPDYTAAHGNLGNALRDKGQLDEAIAAYQHAIGLKPDYAEAYYNLALALKDNGQPEEAIAANRQAIRFKPDLAEAHNNLGVLLEITGRPDEAIVSCRRAIGLKPDFADAHYNLGIALQAKEQFDEAIAAYRQALRIKPDYTDAHYNVGIALQHNGQLDEAIASFRQAARLRPDLAEAHNNLGNALKDNGQLDEAIAAYRQALQLKPDYAEAHSNLAFILHYHPSYDGGMIHNELCRWNQRHAAPLKRFIHPHANDRNPDRRLRIGYVSPDFRGHAVGLNLLPLLRQHDHERMEIFCYSNVVRDDATTGQFRSYADAWRSLLGLSDSQAVDLIQQDRIDVLVDLALHTGTNGLMIFARKPAPVQATFAGYPGSTGLDTIDYRLTDPYLDPPGLNDRFYSETSIRLPDTFWCYDPPPAELSINPLPAESQGRVTFGCLNNFCKVTDAVLALWARVLKAIANSRLLLLAPEGSSRQRVLDRLGRDGIGSERVKFVARLSRLEYRKIYHRIDIGLDTVPYNGHTTSLDSYWMGVPVITLVGRTVVGRAGLSQLTNLGLPELVARTPEQYVQIATDLAGDLPRLAELRRTLRGRMQASPLMDAPRFARNIEAAYRQMWRNWCQSEGKSTAF